MSRLLITAAVAVAAAVAVPSVAHGATIHQDGRTPHRILLQDEIGETNLVSVEGSKSVVFHDLNAPISIDGVPTCMPLDAYTVSCAAVKRVEMDLGAGPDHANLSTSLPVELEGGAGNDHYLSTATSAPSRVTFSQASWSNSCGSTRNLAKGQNSARVWILSWLMATASIGISRPVSSSSRALSSSVGSSRR